MLELLAQLPAPTNVWDAAIVVVPSVMGCIAAVVAAVISYRNGQRNDQANDQIRQDVAVVGKHVQIVKEQGTAAAALTTAATASESITAAVAAGMAKTVPLPASAAAVPEPSLAPSLSYGPDGHL